MDPLSVQAIWAFRVPEAVPLTGQISYEDLTEKSHSLSGVPVPVFNMRRIVRHAITNRFFCEPELGFVAHNRASRLLLEDENMHAWVGLFCNDLWPGFVNTIEAQYFRTLPVFPVISQDERECSKLQQSARTD